MGSLLDLDDLTECHSAARRQLTELREDAECYRWLVAHWARIATDTSWNGVDEPRFAKAIELGPETLGSVDPESLHRAIRRAMAV